MPTSTQSNTSECLPFHSRKIPGHRHPSELVVSGHYWNRRGAARGAIVFFCAIFILFGSVPLSLAQNTAISPAPASGPSTVPMVLGPLAKYAIAANISKLLHDSAGLALVVGATFLLIRVASAKENARFLLHLAGAYAVTGLWRLSHIAVLFVEDHIAFSTPFTGSVNQGLAALANIDRAWDFLDLTFSYFGTLWLFFSVVLIFCFPKQGIPKGWFGGAVAVFGVLAAFVPLLINAAGANALLAFQILDAVTSCFAMVAFGVGMFMLRIGPQNSLLRAMAGISFCLNGICQPLFYLVSDRSMYQAMLMGSGFAAIMLTVISASLYLTDKPRFAAN